VQKTFATLPAGESEFAGHEEHVEPDVAPVADEYVPAPQVLQFESPVVPLYFPAKHGTHVPPLDPEYPALHAQAVRVALAPGDVECAGHDLHSDRSIAEYDPDSQSEHAASSVAPGVLENFPGPQAVHSAGPGSALYLPAAHFVHVPPSSPEDPALQVHAVSTEPSGESESIGHATHVDSPAAPTALEYVPAPQLLHVDAPMTFVYFPAPHSVQVPPSGPKEPTLQLQAVFEALPRGEFEFVGHVKHTDSAFAPSVVEYLPGPQATHPSDPASDLYFPATHVLQPPPGEPV